MDVDSLALRPIALSDAGRVHEWASTSEASRYQPWGPNAEPETRAFVAAAVDAWKIRPQHRWVWAAVDPDHWVDGIGEINLRGRQCAEISYAVHVSFWGRGVGTAIGRLLTRWIFAELPQVERVQATCDPRNIGSKTVLRRIGMTYEGTLRHTLRLRDGWRDSEVFSILRDEWAPI